METENGLLGIVSKGKGKDFLELFTLLYIGAKILRQEFLMCDFTFNIPVFTQFHNLVGVVMLGTGLVLTMLNILFETGWRSSKRVVFLYGISLLDAFASLMAGGIELEWIKRLVRESITVVLFYCAMKNAKEPLLRQMLHICYWVALLCWNMMCCLSLCQFALMLGHGSSRISDILLLQGPGFYGHRLFGVFCFPEWGAVTSVMIMLAGGYYFVSIHRIAERILLTLCNVPILFYLVLSGSRNAQLAFYLSLLLGSGIVCFKRTPAVWHTMSRTLSAMAAALVVCAGAHLGYIVIQDAAEYVPGFFSDYSGPLAHKIPVESLSVDEAEEPPEEGTETELRLVERNDTKENFDSNRFSIWKDYFSLWKEYGVFGLSSTYDSRYIKEHHPDLYICIYDPETVYHPHNGYLKTWVSTGFLGVVFLMLFLLGCVKDVWKAIYASKKIPPEMLFPLLIVVAGCSSAMFDLEIFFVFNTISYIFWLALGILMKHAENVNTSQINGKS